MKRRGFLACLVAFVPSVAIGQLAGAKRAPLLPTGQQVTYHRLDDTTPKHILIDKYCPLGAMFSINEVMFVGPEIGRRLPPSDCTITRHGAEYKAWRIRA